MRELNETGLDMSLTNLRFRIYLGYFHPSEHSQEYLDLDRDFFTRLNFEAHSVYMVLRQAERVVYTDRAGVRCVHEPHSLLIWRKKKNRKSPPPVLSDLVLRSEVAGNWQNWRRRIRAAQTLAQKQGWVYQLWDERRVRTTLLENVKFLHRSSDQPLNVEPGSRLTTRLPARV